MFVPSDQLKIDLIAYYGFPRPILDPTKRFKLLEQREIEKTISTVIALDEAASFLNKELKVVKSVGFQPFAIFSYGDRGSPVVVVYLVNWMSMW